MPGSIIGTKEERLLNWCTSRADFLDSSDLFVDSVVRVRLCVTVGRRVSFGGFLRFFWCRRRALLSLHYPLFSGTDVADALFRGVVKTIVHPIGLDCLESLHPVVFPLFQEPTILGFRVRVVVSDLLDQRKSRVGVEIVVGEREVSIERSPAGVSNVVSVGIHAEVCRRFTLANILCSWT